MSLLSNSSDLPEFIVKSTLGAALVSVLIVTPFGVNHFIQGRYLLGVLTLLVSALSIISAWSCYKGRYSVELNLFGVVPAISIVIILATHQLGVIGSYWAFLVVLAFYFVLHEKLALIANTVFVAIVIPVAWDVLEYQVAIRFSSALLGVSGFAFLAMREITRQHYRHKEQSITDPLTGLYNRSLLQYSLEHAIQQNHRTGTAVTLMMIDVDGFKKINDEYGHNAGDSVLNALGGLLKNFFRESDIVFRIGGEEFLVLVHNTGEVETLNMAEKMRMEIEQLSLIPGHTVTVSIGVSGLRPDMGWQEWMKLCDDKLYRAKSKGKNQVCA